MSTNLLPRLLGVLGIHAVISALFWAIVKFGLATQDGLAISLVERVDGDPGRIQSYLDEMVSALVLAGVGGLLITAVLACLWLYLIHRNPPYGDKSARGKRGSWAGLMIAALFATGTLFWVQVIGAPIAQTLAPSIPLNVTAIGVVLVVVSYWLSTALFAPPSTKVAVPGASLLGR